MSSNCRLLAASLLTSMSSLLTTPANAGVEYALKSLKWYTLVEIVTVTGWIDENGKKKSDFNGCSSGRRLIIDYDKTIECSSSNYSYAYNPDGFIFVKSAQVNMLIDGNVYDMKSR